MSFFLVDLLSKHFDSNSKTCMSAFFVDLMTFQIFKTFQAQDRTCMSFFRVDLLTFQNFHTFQAQDWISMSFFLVDFVSEHFDSVSDICVYPFFALTC